MSLECASIVVDTSCKLTVLNVHILESVSVLLDQKLVEESLLQVYSFNIQQLNKYVVVTAVENSMEGVSSLVVHIELLMDDVLWSTHLGYEIEANILKTEVAGYVKRSSTKLVTLNEELKYIILTLHNA